jgi:two-component system KDP operon response regulator KdpE
VDTALTAADALELAAVNDYNVLILDLGLPDMDGMEVCWQLRQESAVPIVMLTKRAAESDRQAGLAAGANAYMTKPFDADDLLATVRALLPEANAVQ